MKGGSESTLVEFLSGTFKYPLLCVFLRVLLKGKHQARAVFLISFLNWKFQNYFLM